jgi:hypothetical protein
MLTGTDLIARVKEMGDSPKSEIVRTCGYTSTKKDGTERLNFTAFYGALLDAKGVVFGDESKSRRGGGRKLSFTTKVQFNGNLLVGNAYVAKLGYEPGTVFEIKLGRKQIALVPVGSGFSETYTDQGEPAASCSPNLAAAAAVTGSDDYEEEEDDDLGDEEE